METRITDVRRRAFAVLALALIAAGPWIGYWFLLPLAVALVASRLADRFMRASEHPHRWAAVGWGISGVMIAVSIALTGAAGSPAVMWLAIPAVTLGARFEARGVILGVAYLIALMLLSTLALDAQAIYERPDHLIFPIALVIAIAIFSGATQSSEREHRRDAVLGPRPGGAVRRPVRRGPTPRCTRRSGRGAIASAPPGRIRWSWPEGWCAGGATTAGVTAAPPPTLARAAAAARRPPGAGRRSRPPVPRRAAPAAPSPPGR
jgi:hypothetical protein